MTGRPGYRTMEMIGGSSAPYLARTPCVPLFCTSFNRVGNKERFRLPGAGGGSFPLYGGTFARSYSVSTDFDLKSRFSGPNQVEIRSKSGPNQVWAEGFGWVGAGGVGPAGGVPVAPPESLYPKGPKIEKIQDRPPGLKFSIEIEIFKRAARQTPIFVGNSEGPGLIFSIEIDFFQSLGP